MFITKKSSQTQMVSSKERLCLKCDGKFLSAGSHNRICDKCVAINERAYKNEYKIIVNKNKKLNPKNDLESLEELFS